MKFALGDKDDMYCAIGRHDGCKGNSCPHIWRTEAVQDPETDTIMACGGAGFLPTNIDEEIEAANNIYTT